MNKPTNIPLMSLRFICVKIKEGLKIAGEKMLKYADGLRIKEGKFECLNEDQEYLLETSDFAQNALTLYKEKEKEMLTKLFSAPIGKEPWTDEGKLLELLNDMLDLLDVENFALNIEHKINTVNILGMIKDELEEDDTNKSRLLKWFSKAKIHLDNMSLDGEKLEAVEKLYQCVDNIG